jgi:Cdc6-like AAA superfamily ATPase
MPGDWETSVIVEEAKLTKLRELITEGLRVQRDGEAITYINVGHAIEDACARANHTIFARRGCGKTLLLHDSRSKLKSDIRSIYLNCEDFKQHTFPNVLIEILKVLFREIDANLSGWFGKKARTKAIVKQILARLESMHQAPDTLTEHVKESASQATSKKKLGELSGEMSGAKAKIGAEGTTHSNINTERTFERHQQKLQELDLWLPELKANLREFFSISTNVRAIFLQIDDLYHLKRTDQAFIVDYIHRLCKDVPLYFKFATIRHASSLFLAAKGSLLALKSGTIINRSTSITPSVTSIVRSRRTGKS